MHFLAKCCLAIVVGALLALGHLFTLSSWRRERVVGWLFIVYILLILVWQVILHFRSRGKKS